MPYLTKKALQGRLARAERNGAIGALSMRESANWKLPQKPDTRDLDALDLVIDVFGLREQYPDAESVTGFVDRGTRGAKAFLDDLKLATTFAKGTDAYTRIQAALKKVKK